MRLATQGLNLTQQRYPNLPQVRVKSCQPDLNMPLPEVQTAQPPKLSPYWTPLNHRLKIVSSPLPTSIHSENKSAILPETSKKVSPRRMPRLLWSFGSGLMVILKILLKVLLWPATPRTTFVRSNKPTGT